MTTPTPGELIQFDQVLKGDRLTFLTRDNGFDGSGDDIERTGIVTLKTDKAIDLHVGGGIHVFRNGKDRIEGAGARLLRSEWYGRCVRLAERGRLPYEADFVVYVDFGTIVWAMWTPDPVKAAAPQSLADTIHHPANSDAELIATMQRQTRAQGYSNSGWVMGSGSNPGDYVGASKREAMATLRAIVAEHFRK
ncbi:hypothetical protein AB0395_34820 [Streptosporangium sp. NPDC051023]|uniref:hypothetical protein n=1 Tax=Streptosporangium sp. NPDC051023 TaxID=3155410 RepID=UPI00344CA7EF